MCLDTGSLFIDGSWNFFIHLQKYSDMYTRLITLLFLCLSINALSQDLVLGSLNQVGRVLNNKPQIIGQASGFIYIFYSKGSVCYLDKINKDNLERTITLTLKIETEDNVPPVHLFQFIVDETIYLFYSKTADGADKLFCMKAGVDVPVVEKEIVTLGKNSYYYQEFVPKILFAISPDSTKLLFKYSEWNKQEKEVDHVFVLLNKDLQQLDSWTAPAGKESYQLIHSLTLDNAGNAYFLKTIADGRSWLVSFFGKDHATRELFLDISESSMHTLAFPSGIHIHGKSLIVAGHTLEYRPDLDYYYVLRNKKVLGTFAIGINLEDNSVLFRKTNVFDTNIEIFEDLFMVYTQKTDAEGNYVLIDEHYYESYHHADYASLFVNYHTSDGSLVAKHRIPVVFRPDIDRFNYFRHVVTFNGDKTNIYLNDPLFEDAFFPRKSSDASTGRNPLKFSISRDSKLDYSKDYRRSEYEISMKSRTNTFIAGNCLYFIGSKGKYYRIGMIKETPVPSGVSAR